MKNNKGFTLMEILLAAMIVGVIGIALAALTTAAVRESGVARTRTMLRHQLSSMLRQLRQDIEQSSSISFSNGSTSIELMRTYPPGPNQDTTQVNYYYTAGSRGEDGAFRGGTISRGSTVLLNNVKGISSSGWTSPSFQLIKVGGSASEINSLLRVRIILEVPTTPVVNETVEEVFALPHGFAVSDTGE